MEFLHVTLASPKGDAARSRAATGIVYATNMVHLLTSPYHIPRQFQNSTSTPSHFHTGDCFRRLHRGFWNQYRGVLLPFLVVTQDRRCGSRPAMERLTRTQIAFFSLHRFVLSRFYYPTFSSLTPSLHSLHSTRLSSPTPTIAPCKYAPSIFDWNTDPSAGPPINLLIGLPSIFDWNTDPSARPPINILIGLPSTFDWNTDPTARSPINILIGPPSISD